MQRQSTSEEGHVWCIYLRLSCNPETNVSRLQEGWRSMLSRYVHKKVEDQCVLDKYVHSEINNTKS